MGHGDVKNGTPGRALILQFSLCCGRRFIAFLNSQNV